MWYKYDEWGRSYQCRKQARGKAIRISHWFLLDFFYFPDELDAIRFESINRIEFSTAAYFVCSFWLANIDCVYSEKPPSIHDNPHDTFVDIACFSIVIEKKK